MQKGCGKNGESAWCLATRNGAELVPTSLNRATTTVQQTLVHLFLARFTLTEHEVKALTSREVPVGPELFAAMDKVERIRADCRALLSGEAGEGTQAGLVCTVISLV